MKALVKTPTGPALQELPEPILQAPDDVLVEVQAAGICRTDLYVAQNLIKSPPNLILGHEATGRIVEIGSQVDNIQVGDQVVINPLRSCQNCSACQSQQQHNCEQSRFMGVDFSGAFCEFVTLPAREVHRYSQALDPFQAAYTEPLASTRAILESSLSPGMSILVLGDDRITELTARVLTRAGFSKVSCQINPAPSELFEAIVETCPDPEDILSALPHLKPNGLLILKSRSPDSLPLPLIPLIKKRLRIEFVYFSPFEEALAETLTDKEWLADLVGPRFELADYEDAFRKATQNTSQKIYFSFL